MEFGWINLFGAGMVVIPTVIFLLSGILLHHWFLVVAAVLFGIAHCKITYVTHKEH